MGSPARKSSKLTLQNLLPLLWLFWLLYPVQAFLAEPHSLSETLLFWLSLAGFVGLYLQVFAAGTSAWASAGWLAGLAMWGLGFWLYGFSASTFLIYGASLIGWQGRSDRALLGAGVNAALLTVALLLYPPTEWGDFFFVLLIFVAAYNTHAGYKAAEAGRRLTAMQQEQERLAAEAERERIARDLHDLLGHTLSVIVLKSELAGKLADKNPEQAAQEIREVEQIGREALREVRAAVQGYRGSGLQAELARAKVALDAAGVKLTLLGQAPALCAAVEASAAMLLREAVTNVVRHAQASEVRVSWAEYTDGWQLVIQDDGIGASAPEGTGLNSMRERLRALGGTLERSTRPGEGTRLVARFPR